jgi:acetyl-CoA carboxylase, biotin carboxylase subunit
MLKLRKILVANRGEIAVRLMRTCREMNIATVAIYSEADRASLHVRTADQAYCVGPAPSRESYLAIDRILEVAKKSRADAIHPGYGFLSENPAFVRACERAGIVFIGPPASAMDAMGEKTRARTQMIRAGVPVVPGTSEPLRSLEQAQEVAHKIGYPVMLKAAGGGGGKGMRKVDKAEDLGSAWQGAKSESLSAFGNDAVYLEKYLEKPHHVEIQVFADTHANCIHLNERECSVQRRHQKVIEETPSPIVSAALREAMGRVAVRAAKAVGYVSAGTVEFLLDVHRNFYFLEMNTRLQVEHPVTEWVLGQDLVAWQIKVAQGERLPIVRTLFPRGHAIEARIYAEDPARNFLPSPGTIQYLSAPSGPWIRDDSGVYAGYPVSTFYDPMISKLSAWAPTRAEAIQRLHRALGEYVVKGITTNIQFLQAVLEHPQFVSGDYDTGFLTRENAKLTERRNPDLEQVAVIAAAVYAQQRDLERSRSLADRKTDQRVSAWRWGGRFARRRTRLRQ